MPHTASEITDTFTARRRGDAILRVMQALRAHRADPPTGGQYAAFDEAHAVVTALAGHGYMLLADAAA